MKIVFRVDASVSMGTGHLMRCLTFAEALRDRGTDVSFICREHKGHLIRLILSKGFKVTILPCINNIEPEGEDYAAWLGVPQSMDAEQTLKAIEFQNPDWLVVDHYGIDANWEMLVKPFVGKLMVIDDLANREHVCDLLMDQNYSIHDSDRYNHLVPKECMQMIGARYALLRKEYLIRRQVPSKRDGKIKRVLVFFGGTDPDNLTTLSLLALARNAFSNLIVDIVVGTNNPYKEEIKKLVHARPRTTIHFNLPHLADLMSSADLAIGAGGSTNLERMCLGLPTLLIACAENQKLSSIALAKMNLVSYLGYYTTIDVEVISEAIVNLMSDPLLLKEMSIRNKILVDGLGTSRLVEVLIPSELSEIKLRLSCEDDVYIYYNWVNDKLVRENSINSLPIQWETHEHWFKGKLEDKNSIMFLCELAGLPIGQVRFDIESGNANIDYSLDPIVRGRGLASLMLSRAMDLVAKMKDVVFVADVKSKNLASCSVFRRLGFLERKDTISQDDFLYRYTLRL